MLTEDEPEASESEPAGNETGGDDSDYIPSDVELVPAPTPAQAGGMLTPNLLRPLKETSS